MTALHDMISLTGRPDSRILRTAFVLLISLAAFGVPSGLTAQTKAQAKAQDNSDLDAQLTKVRDQILELKTRLREEEKKEATVLSGLDRINLQRTILKNELDLYTLRMEKAGREQAALKKAIPPLKSKLDKEKEAMLSWLARSCTTGSCGPSPRQGLAWSAPGWPPARRCPTPRKPSKP